MPDRSLRSGRLHIDFGYISEDGFWPDDGAGALVVGEWEREDGINGTTPDGIFTPDEDIGLDGQGADGDQGYSADYGSDANPYPRHQRHRGNNREDTEDLNGDTSLNRDNGYFTATIDLRETEPLVDVVYDYDDLGDMLADQSPGASTASAWASVDSVADELDRQHPRDHPRAHLVRGRRARAAEPVRTIAAVGVPVPGQPLGAGGRPPGRATRRC